MLKKWKSKIDVKKIESSLFSYSARIISSPLSPLFFLILYQNFQMSPSSPISLDQEARQQLHRNSTSIESEFITWQSPIKSDLFITSDLKLAPSPRILEYLIRKGRIPNPSMALVEVPVAMQPLEENKPMQEPPRVVITPSDPWPRPYYLKGGLRRVAPYHFTYNTNCKERWRGRTLFHIFADEFRDRPEEYYVSFSYLVLC